VGQVAKAEQSYAECTAIFNARRMPGRLSVVRYNMATMYRQIGLDARRHAQRAIDAAAAKRHATEARSWFEKAKQILQSELAYVSRLRLAANDFRRHNRESVLGELHLDLGDFTQARQLFQGAKAFSDRILGKDNHGRDLMNLGLAQCALGRYDDALSLFRRASKNAKEQLGEHKPLYAMTLALQARALGHLGRWKEAGRVMDQCQRLERRYALEVLPTLSQSEQLSYLFRPGYLEGGNFDLALALGAAGGKALREQSAEWLINTKAMVHELLADRSRFTRCGEAAKLARDLSALRAGIARLVAIINAYPDGSNEHKIAVRDLSTLINRESTLSKQLGRTAGTSDRPLWIGLGDVRKSMPRGAVLIELARFRAPKFGSKGATALVGSPRYAAWVIPAAGSGKVALVDLGDARAIEASVRALRDGMDRDVQTVRNQVIREFETELAAFAKKKGLGPNDPRYQAKRAALLQTAFRKMGERLRAQAPRLQAAYRRLAADCAKRIMHPLAGHLRGAKQVLLSPDAHLWLPPWGALPLREGGRYLVEEKAVTCLVSGRDLLARRGAKAKPAAPVIFGDIDYDLGVRHAGDRIAHPASRLAYSPVEVRAIRPHLETYAGTKPLVYTGRDATEERLKAVRNPKVLFLSTHGVFGSVDEARFVPGREGLLFENPMMRCTLSLAGCNRKPRPGDRGEDGRLYGIEVDALDLRGTDLVILSACQTALGDVHAGQGAAGLRQAFQLAGARSVLATLWSVDDEATTRLTIALCKALGSGASTAEALRQGQLALLRAGETSHPFFWAAFTITRSGGE
ncbi:MAG: hypothetical protein CMJ18_02705, partial [Phycisphaeraceae bacterium]|nr:hypothetical protein [Phycisphaeraceae bacterium]